MPQRIVPVNEDDVVMLKKPHPCGTNAWRVTRIGMDIGLECTGCNRRVMLVRSEFDRRYKAHISHARQGRSTR